MQISELDLTQTGLRKKDLSSVFWISPVGASVPAICTKKIKKLFPNLKVRKHRHDTFSLLPPHENTMLQYH